jgi:hypothetical protein
MKERKWIGVDWGADDDKVAVVTLVGDPPRLFEHQLIEKKRCPRCGEKSHTVSVRLVPAHGSEPMPVKDALMCDCCFLQLKGIPKK